MSANAYRSLKAPSTVHIHIGKDFGLGEKRDSEWWYTADELAAIAAEKDRRQAAKQGAKRARALERKQLRERRGLQTPKAALARGSASEAVTAIAPRLPSPMPPRVTLSTLPGGASGMRSRFEGGQSSESSGVTATATKWRSQSGPRTWSAPFDPPEWPPRVVQRIPLGFIPRGATAYFELTDEQIDTTRSIARTDVATLEGPSGSGKTHLAAQVAIAHAQQLRRRVLFLSPRKALAMWLSQALTPHGIEVFTVTKYAQGLLDRWNTPVARTSYVDPVFFAAACDAVRHGSVDVVIADEWQAFSDEERRFVEKVARGCWFLKVTDPTRQLREVAQSPQTLSGRLFVLSEPKRGSVGLQRLCRAYADPTLTPFPASEWQKHMGVTHVDAPEDSAAGVRAALAAVEKLGIPRPEAGIVSLLGRMQSRVVQDFTTYGAQPRAFTWDRGDLDLASRNLACDTFAQWNGIERKALILVDAHSDLAYRSIKMHCAISRACEYVHLVMTVEQLEADEVLTGWMGA